MTRQTTETGRLKKLRALWPLAALATAGFALGACTTEDTGDGPASNTTTAGYTLLPFESCDSLDDYLTDYTADLLQRAYTDGYYGGGVSRGGGFGAEPPMANDDLGSTPTSGSADAAEGGGESQGPGDFTGTNVQEVGVDEPDLTKTDGEYLYTIENSTGETTVHIYDAWPPEDATELAVLTVDGWGERLLLLDDTLLAFTEIYEGNPYDDYYGGGREVPSPGIDGESTEGSTGEGSTGSSGSTTEPTPVEDPDTGDSGGDNDAPDVGSDEPMPDVPREDVEYFAGVRVSVIDVSDPADPQLTVTYDLEGSMVDARMVDGIVYFASNFGVDALPYELQLALEGLDVGEPDYSAPRSDREAAATTLVAEMRPIIRDYLANGGRSALIPDVRVNGEDRTDMFDCTDFMRPAQRAQVGVLSVLGFDPASGQAPSGMALLAAGWELYGSAENVYIAQDSRWWWFEDGQDPVTKTHIHQFTLNAGNPVYVASGRVDGWLLNQFALSEHDGVLRVATTDEGRGFWGAPNVGATTEPAMDGGEGVSSGTTTSVDAPPSTEPAEPPGSDSGDGDDVLEPEPTEPVDEPEPVDDEPMPMPEPEPEPEPGVDANNVFTLERDGRELNVVGEVRGLAPGEQIFAVRFIGDKGYVVTFRQTDPLFTIDLSDPTNPTVMGELHITGFSNYLHPVGTDHLLGIGQEADEWGGVQGLHLQLFDVSDMENPTRIAHHVFDSGWSYSEAQHDHHAVTYWASQGLLAIPATVEDWDGDDGYNFFSGLVIFDVSVETGFVEVGRVSHSSLVADRYCGDIHDSEQEYVCESGEMAYYVNMRRSVFMDDYVYAISSLGVTLSAIESPEDLVQSFPYYSGE